MRWTLHWLVIPEAFEELAKLLRGYPNLLEQSRFVFMPGPGDPGPAAALPRPALPRSLMRPLQAAVPHAHFVSNPCRIRWHAQDVVLFREDLAARMRGACVRPPTDDGFDAGADADTPAGVPPPTSPGERLFGHLCATVLQQSHLAPLPLPHAPVHWEWDHALWLYPTPHMLLLADRTAPQASAPFEDTACLNPVRAQRLYSFVDGRRLTHVRCTSTKCIRARARLARTAALRCTAPLRGARSCLPCNTHTFTHT
jgi:DNA polymerase epsilon subunit 2